MAKRPEFQEKQFAFAAHIRDPKHVPAPDDIEDRRMAVYRDLFFNNLKSLLSNMFPVLIGKILLDFFCPAAGRFSFHVSRVPVTYS